MQPGKGIPAEGTAWAKTLRQEQHRHILEKASVAEAGSKENSKTWSCKWRPIK